MCWDVEVLVGDGVVGSCRFNKGVDVLSFRTSILGGTVCNLRQQAEGVGVVQPDDAFLAQELLVHSSQQQETLSLVTGLLVQEET